MRCDHCTIGKAATIAQGVVLALTQERAFAQGTMRHATATGEVQTRSRDDCTG